MTISNPELGRLGYKIAIFFTILGLYFCLSPYLMPAAWHHQISLLLYDTAYTTEALPASSKFFLDRAHSSLIRSYFSSHWFIPIQ